MAEMENELPKAVEVDQDGLLCRFTPKEKQTILEARLVWNTVLGTIAKLKGITGNIDLHPEVLGFVRPKTFMMTEQK